MTDVTTIDVSTRRPPYLAALVVFVLVFAGYSITLAPSVTFWDAGELIAAVHTLGIPHPPGTPLFIMLGHVWSKLVPVGEVAFRLNLMSAFFSAMGAGLFFLVAHHTLAQQMAGLEGGKGRLLALGGGAAAAVIGAFTFTIWQNSNETEVYSVATFIIAGMCWAAHMWREERPRFRSYSPVTPPRRPMAALDRIPGRRLDGQPPAGPLGGTGDHHIRRVYGVAQPLVRSSPA